MTRRRRFPVLAVLCFALPAVAATGAGGFVAAPGFVQALVDAASPGDTIELPAATFPDNVDVDKPLTIRGAGPGATVIDGGGLGSVFVVSDAVVTLAGMTLTRGVAVNGGGVRVEGATAGLHLDRCRLVDNRAETGGAVYSDAGAVTIATSTISGNSAAWASGVASYGGDLSIRDSSVSGNFSEIHNAVYANAENAEIELSIVGTTISDNDAGQPIGFAVELRAWDFPLHATIVNSTVSGNSGGGIFTSEAYSVLDAEIAHVTIHANGSDPDRLLGGLWGSGPAVTVRGSIIAGNIGTHECPPRAFVTSLGGNVSADDSCDFYDSTDLENTDPLLLPLADNGGPTPTHALDAASPAIDAAGPTCEAADQRGVPRPRDGDGDGIALCDSGSFEARSAPFDVEVDILPRVKENRVNLSSRRMIPVALLGGADLDVTEVDPATLRFGPKRVSPLRGGGGPFVQQGYPRDVDGDGYADLVAWFPVRGAGIACGDTRAEVTGETFGGEAFRGDDAIETVGCAATPAPFSRKRGLSPL